MSARRKEDAAPRCTPLGYLGAAAPKPAFAYFCLATKVGRAEARNASVPLAVSAEDQKRKWGADPHPPAARGIPRQSLRLKNRNNAAGRGIRPALSAL